MDIGWTGRRMLALRKYKVVVSTTLVTEHSLDRQRVCAVIVCVIGILDDKNFLLIDRPLGTVTMNAVWGRDIERKGERRREGM